MNKQEQRKVMSTLAFSKVTDLQALTFIKNFAQEQMYKSSKSFETFCTNCGIFYTSHPTMMLLHKDDYNEWSEGFIRSCSYLEILTETFGKDFKLD